MNHVKEWITCFQYIDNILYSCYCQQIQRPNFNSALVSNFPTLSWAPYRPWLFFNQTDEQRSFSKHYSTMSINSACVWDYFELWVFVHWWVFTAAGQRIWDTLKIRCSVHIYGNEGRRMWLAGAFRTLLSKIYSLTFLAKEKYRRSPDVSSHTVGHTQLFNSSVQNVSASPP